MSEIRTRQLSPSSARLYLQCPLQWRLHYIDKLRGGATVDQFRGTVTHGGAEDAFDLDPSRRTPEAVKALLRRHMAEVPERDPKIAALLADGEESMVLRLKIGNEILLDGQTWMVRDIERVTRWDPLSVHTVWLTADGARPRVIELPGDTPVTRVANPAAIEAEAGQLIDTWFRLEHVGRLAPASREQEVSCIVRGDVTLRGYIDRTDVALGRGLRIVDYKTGKPPKPKYAADKQWQLKFYGLVVWLSTGLMPTMTRLVFLGEDGGLLDLALDEAMLEAFEHEVIELWGRIEADTLSGSFEPNESKLCSWCPVRQFCPVAGGVTPPYPDDALDRVGLGAPEWDW